MLSYIFMKVFERDPSSYESRIRVIAGGHLDKVRKKIIDRYVEPGMEVLDLGCGTGAFLVSAAEKGAFLTGIDSSAGMIHGAEETVRQKQLQDRVTLHHADIIELDTLFEKQQFDLIVSTLVFSEMYTDLRRWTLHHLHTILKPEGRCVIADEVRPRKRFPRWVHAFLRAVPTVITSFRTHHTTTPLTHWEEELRNTGFEVKTPEYSRGGSFGIFAAAKPVSTSGVNVVPGEPDHHMVKVKSSGITSSQLDSARRKSSILKPLWNVFGRWFPNPVEPGLRSIGNPDSSSPVMVTSNYHRTVTIVEQELQGLDCYLLVVPTGGVNVWCAACGGSFSVTALTKAIKTSGIETLVRHRTLILPQLAAPGFNAEKLKIETGWEGVYGPVRIGDIRRYLERGKEKSYHMRKARFDLGFRMEMLVTMNSLTWVIIGVALTAVQVVWGLWFTLLFWSSGAVLYGFYHYVPGKSSMAKVACLSVIEAGAAVGFGFFMPGLLWWSLWYYIAAITGINILLGYDIKGIAGGHISEMEWLLYRTGFPLLRNWFSFENKSMGSLVYRKDRCIHCFRCFDVCPQGVFGSRRTKNEMYIRNRQACFLCNGCTHQCPTEAIIITSEEEGDPDDTN